MKTKGAKKVPLHPRPMNTGVVSTQSGHSLNSHYTGQLASDNYFSQKEINSKPTKRINASLSKKNGPSVKKDKWGADFDELESMRSSSSSFYNHTPEVNISQEQKEKIKSRPFSGKFKPNNRNIVEDTYEQVEEELDYNNLDREALK